MVCASLLFAVMGSCVKLASGLYGAGEIVLYRALVGLVLMAVVVHWRGVGWRTRFPALHFWRSLSDTTALCAWFYAIGGLPLATAMTLNYMSSVWIALFLVGGAVLLGARGEQPMDHRLVAAVMAGFVGVALVLRPTLEQQQLWHGLVGLASGLISAVAYLQVTALGRAGEPEVRVVFYFALGGVVLGGALMVAQGVGPFTLRGAALLLAVGVLATAGQVMMTRAFAIGHTLANAALQYLGIAWGFVFGVLLFGEPVTLLALAGVTLIVAAGLVATGLRSAAGAPHGKAAASNSEL